MQECVLCGKNIIGRSDKKFCSSYCKTAYHYEKSKQRGVSKYERINKILRKNRKILKQYNRGGMTIINKSMLHYEGFNPDYYTHRLKDKKGRQFTFCFEFGYQSGSDIGEDKYMIITSEEDIREE